ncbi:MAG: T9SS type A sorting domain-containing protein [Bacteroidales bacterium]
MKKGCIFGLFCLILSSSSLLFAQVQGEVGAYLFSTAGGFEYCQASNPTKISYLMSWSIGEPITETFAASKKQLTQGFLQAQPIPKSPTALDTLLSQGSTGEFAYKVKLYPNPCTSIAYLSIAQAQNEYFTLEISDIQGHLLQKINTKTGSTIVNLDLSDYRAGMYLVRVHAHLDNQSKVFRIIKN